MFGFFSDYKQYITLRNFAVVYNGLTGLAVLYSLWSNPEADPSEYAIDISIHALTAITLMCKQAPESVKAVAMALNTYRGFDALFKAITSLPSTIPGIANAVDVLNHRFNFKELEELGNEETVETRSAVQHTM
ncbi:TPA: lpg0260 family Dot/Icm T4SS effector [Legionella pneumophila]|nr:lpg0260 family Dot/Icm T4SS effector [Legionella pneumophila]